MRVAVVASMFLALTASASAAQAQAPTVGQCLAATETSGKLLAAKKLRAARAELLTCAAPTCPAEIRSDCTQRINELNAALPTIVFSAKTGGGAELTAVRVTMDGEAVTDHLDGTALTLDPGSHTFTFTSEGQPTVSETLVLHEGEKNRREAVVLGAEASLGGHDGHAQRVAGIVAGSGGVVGLGLGAIFGALASSKWSSAKGACPGLAQCNSTAISDQTSASGLATGSTVGFIAGGVLLAGGITLYLTAPKGAASTVGLDVSPQGFALKGAF